MLEGQMPHQEVKKEELEVNNESSQGMVASASEGERRVRTGPDGNPTGELTDAEYKEYLENFNN